jgi:hypothetical protein
MVSSSLNDYVRAQLQRGYKTEQIRMALLQAGYNPQDIDFALRVSARQPARKLVISGRTMVFALAGILAIILLVFAGLLLFKPAQKEISLSLRLGQTELLPGGTLSIMTTITSAQSRSVPVSLQYVIGEPFGGKTITSRQGSVDVGTSAVDTQTIQLPAGIPPGEYEVKLTAVYEYFTRLTSARFTVSQPAPEQPVETVTTPEQKPIEVSPEEEELVCPASCDDLNPATDDSCVRGSCIHTPKSNFCGNGECEAGENPVLCPQDCGGAVQDKAAVMQQAVEKAKSDPEKAAIICSGLIVPDAADPCFAAIANASQKSALCANIQDLRRRDDCLMNFAFSGDYSVCDQLNNRYFLTSCMSLARLSIPLPTQAEIAAEANLLQNGTPPGAGLVE